jgi:predicted PurR-regulated permease PerM
VLRAQQAARCWRCLGLVLRGFRPNDIARFLLVLAIIVGILSLMRLAGITLAPFLFGLALAYLSLPLVNSLARALPRALAATLVVTLELLAILALLGAFVPALIEQLGLLAATLPDTATLQRWLDGLVVELQTLPLPVQRFIDGALRGMIYQVRDNFALVLQEFLAATARNFFNLLNTLGFILGFLVVPTFVVAALRDQHEAVRALDRALPRALRADVWAILRIADHTLRGFITGQLLAALTVGSLVYLGIETLGRLGLLITPYALLLGLAAGAMQLIPAIGPLLGALPALLIALPQGSQATLVVIALYAGTQLIVSRLIMPRVERRYAGQVPQAVLLVAVVALSQFGLIWLLLASPLTAMAWDLGRYLFGRLSSPPRPAGLLPGEPMSKRASSAAQPPLGAVRRR